MALPAPTPLAATTRYIPAGKRRVVFVPTIAAKSAPTSVEITAGTDVTAEMNAISGFDTTSSMVDVPDFGTRYTAKVPGMGSSGDSSITLYCSDSASDARTLLVQDLTGYIVIFPEGIVTGRKCNVYPVTVMSSTIEQVAPDAPATMLVSFAVTSVPAVNIAIPTA